MYLIQNRSDPNQFWSDTAKAWVTPDEASRISRSDQARRVLPVGSTWVYAWQVDLIQFARFIAEFEATGGFDQDALVDVSISMDLELEYVEQIIDRAQRRWDAEKEKIPR